MGQFKLRPPGRARQARGAPARGPVARAARRSPRARAQPSHRAGPRVFGIVTVRAPTSPASYRAHLRDWSVATAVTRRARAFRTGTARRVPSASSSRTLVASLWATTAPAPTASRLAARPRAGLEPAATMASASRLLATRKAADRIRPATTRLAAASFAPAAATRTATAGFARRCARTARATAISSPGVSSSQLLRRASPCGLAWARRRFAFRARCLSLLRGAAGSPPVVTVQCPVTSSCRTRAQGK